MKYGVFLIVVAAIIFLCCFPAYAEVYNDDKNSLSLDINQGDGIYYYTPQNDNLFDDLEQKIKSDGRDVRFYVTKYNADNTQPYALVISAQPLPQPQNANVDLYDITSFSGADKTNVLNAALGDFKATFNFTDPVENVFGGINALLVRGVNKQDPEDNLDIYISANGSNYIIAQARYFNTQDNSQINSLIHSAKYSDDILAIGKPDNKDAVSVQASTPSQAATPIPTETIEVNTISTESEKPNTNEADNQTIWDKTGAFFLGIWGTIESAYQNDPFFIWYIIGAAAILLLVIILTLSNKKRRFKENGFESQFNVEEDLTVLEDISITPRSGDDKANRESRLILTDFNGENDSYAPRKIVHRMDETIMFNPHKDSLNSEDDRYAQNNHIEEQIDIEDDEEESYMSSAADFEKDISKYTRQPGSDVNDISKNTVNTYEDEDFADELTRTKTNGTVSQNTHSWKTQGTRMSRHKKKK